MSRTAIFSDIHGNLKALEAVVADANSAGAQNFACLGDIVGYGPNPIECIAALQKIDCVCVKGNHDDDASNNRSLENLNDEARASLEWTRKRLSSSQKDWLAALPYQRRLGRNMLVHASLDNPEVWNYVRNRFDAASSMQMQKTPLCFFGHTHVPAAYCKEGVNVSALSETFIHLQTEQSYLINVGSVGQPRDGVPEASYVIFDRVERTLDFRRVPYDVQAVVEEINSSELPSTLGERLISAA